MLVHQPRSQGSLLPVPTERVREGRRENLGTRLVGAQVFLMIG